MRSLLGKLYFCNHQPNAIQYLTTTMPAMDTLPQDPIMLLGVVNMKLRDCYSSLEDLCEDMNLDRSELESRLAAAGFAYSHEHNRFW